MRKKTLTMLRFSFRGQVNKFKLSRSNFGVKTNWEKIGKLFNKKTQSKYDTNTAPAQSSVGEISEQEVSSEVTTSKKRLDVPKFHGFESLKIPFIK